MYPMNGVISTFCDWADAGAANPVNATNVDARATHRFLIVIPYSLETAATVREDAFLVITGSRRYVGPGSEATLRLASRHRRGNAMGLNPIPTELTTAATDAFLAVLALGCIRWLGARRSADPSKVTLWVLLLALLVVASALGAVAHGFDLSPDTLYVLWQPLFLSLGLVVALFVVAAVYDGFGAVAARRLLIPALVVGVAFYLLTLLLPGTFLVFVLYEAAAMVAALAIYGWLAMRSGESWAWLMVLGIALNLVAAAIQASGTVQLNLGVPFDHNGVFHLVQMVAIVVLVAGVGASLKAPRATKNTE
jgi:hypothetical protein